MATKKKVSRSGKAAGGVARALVLSPEERSEIAKNAAMKRWGNDLPRETHPGEIRLGEVVLPCAVLDNETRILKTMGITRAFGSSKKTANTPTIDGSPQPPAFLKSKSISEFISSELLEKMVAPVAYKPRGGGSIAYGYDCNALPGICEAILDAQNAGKLRHNQAFLAAAAQAILRGLARVGITALIDEATGYQDERARGALAKILEAFVATELRPWLKTFPVDFYREMFRLRGWQFDPNSVKRPPLVGTLTNNVVYSRLAPGVLDELQRVTPRDEKGRLKTHLHRRLTPDVGHPKLQEHLAVATALMTVSSTWDGFVAHMDHVKPKFDSTRSLFPEPENAPSKKRKR